MESDPTNHDKEASLIHLTMKLYNHRIMQNQFRLVFDP